MIIRKEDAKTFPIVACHGGRGTVMCREILGEYDKSGAGIKYIHDDLLDPGATIGEHVHLGDEEVYFIIEGNGEMTLDGVRHEIRAGDVCVTRHGERHSLKNTGGTAMRLLVIAANLCGPADPAHTSSP